MLGMRQLVPLDTLESCLFNAINNIHIPDALMPPDDAAHSPSSTPPSDGGLSAAPAPFADTTRSQNHQSPSPVHKCEWRTCDRLFSDPEVLYNHLCNDHIGRKSTNNLCLTCHWRDCGTSCAKRDHITSHLRVHTPLKPHICEVCKKSFKRPQDLKKHEKIHTEEHHAVHKHSKAVTVQNPEFLSRVRGEPPQYDRHHQSFTPHHPKERSVSSHGTPDFSSPASSLPSSLSPDFGVLPTPSPELNHPTPHHHQYSQNRDFWGTVSGGTASLPMWEVLRDDGTAALSSGAGGMKRSHDSAVEDFFQDMKKRRVNPSYDNHMAERLSNLAFAQQQLLALGAQQQQQQQYGGPHHTQGSFSPRQVQLDIRSPEELAAVNEFLIALGRDVTSNNSRQQQQQHLPLTPSEISSPSSYFDTAGLSQLGLQNMPGIPSIPSPPSSYGKYSPPRHDRSMSQVDSRQGSMYPSFSEEMPQTSVRDANAAARAQPPQTIAIPAYPAPLPRLSPSGLSSASKMASRSTERVIRPSSSHTASSTGSSSARSADPSSAYNQTRAHSGAVQLTSPYTQHRHHVDNADSFSYLSDNMRVQQQQQQHQSLSIAGRAGSSGQFSFGNLSSGMTPAMAPPQLSGYDYTGSRPQNRMIEVPLKTAPDGQMDGGKTSDGAEGQSEEEGSDRKRLKEDFDFKPPRAVEPRVRMSRHRGMPARMTSSSPRNVQPPSRSSSSSTSDGSTETDETSLSSIDSAEEGKLYPLLTAGDAQFRLPPLKNSPSSLNSPSTPSSPIISSTSTKRKSPSIGAHSNSIMRVASPVVIESDGSRTPSPDNAGASTRLPSLRSLAPELRLPAHVGVGGDLLASGVQRLRLQQQQERRSAAPSAAERRQHAELIKNLLISVNESYRMKYGNPSGSESSKRGLAESFERGGDIEMASA